MPEVNQHIQDIHHKGREIDLGHLLESSLIERMDIVGPLLILRFNDIDSIIKEEYGIKKDDELTVSYGDPLGRDVMHESERFTVLSMPFINNVRTINLVQTDSLKLLMPANEARFFVRESPISVVKNLLGGSPLRFASSVNIVTEDYHLLPKTLPAKLIRQIARETGSFAFINRGVFKLDNYDALKKSANTLEYHYRDTREENQIIEFRQMDGEWKKEGVVKKNHAFFDIKKGIVRSSNYKKAATEWMGVGSKLTIDSMRVMASPVLELLMEGHGGLKPGEICKIKWNKLQTESPIDESIHDEIMVGAVTHYTRANRYQCKVMGVIQ